MVIKRLATNEIHEEKSNKKKKRQQLEARKINNYEGWKIPFENYDIETISLSTITPKAFYDKFVFSRKPVIITDIYNGEENQLENLKYLTNNYLKKISGDETVEVEIRNETSGKFGHGEKHSMIFSEFLNMIEKGDHRYYLTTQDIKEGEIMSNFMRTIVDSIKDFPMKLKIAGNLILQSLNLWIGNNINGSSSGLHHDFHDNFYILLRGKKKFELYSPADALNMYTNGKIVNIHPNGLINYNSITTGHGVSENVSKKYHAVLLKQKAEKDLLDAENDVKNDIKGAKDRLVNAEKTIEKALDMLLDIEYNTSLSDYEDCEENESDNDEIIEHHDYDDSETEPEDPYDSLIPNNFLKNESVSSKVNLKDPPNFSTVNTEIDPKKSNERFPLIQKAKKIACEISKNQIIYLPASWFHEVTSYSSEDDLSSGHVALNYWFHPSNSKEKNFDEPYTDTYWLNEKNNNSNKK